jgi:SAM-dependent methyltransferase
MTAALTNARHRANARTPAWLLTLRFLALFRWRYLARFPSNHAWMVLRRKYDAVVTDRAYENRPESWLGSLGRWADRRVLDYPVHVGLRQRLELVTDALVDAIAERVGDGASTTRVLSAPSGLARDLVLASTRARDERGIALDRLELHGLDLDESGEVIPEAQRRLELAGLDATFHREDVFAAAGPALVAAQRGPFDIVNCIGLASWISIDEVEQLVAGFRRLVAPGGVLLIDNFAWHDHSDMGADLEINTIYHPPDEFIARIERAGFRIAAARPTANGVCTLHVAVAT